MATHVLLHLDPDEPCEITCSHQLNNLKPEGYPVLAIGTLTVYPTRERLERLRAVISAYLAAHPETDANVASCPECGRRLRPSGSGAYRCGHCGTYGVHPPWPGTSEPDGPAESLESMALEELKSDLTEAAHEVGIDPDGMTDGEVIRALVRRPPATLASKCHYCERPATRTLVWLKDKRQRPARIRLPWCGCNLMEALRKIWAMPYQVVEGEDFVVEPLTDEVREGEPDAGTGRIKGALQAALAKAEKGGGA